MLPRLRARAASRTAATSVSAAPGCTCQNPSAAHPPLAARGDLAHPAAPAQPGHVDLARRGVGRGFEGSTTTVAVAARGRDDLELGRRRPMTRAGGADRRRTSAVVSGHGSTACTACERWRWNPARPSAPTAKRTRVRQPEPVGVARHRHHVARVGQRDAVDLGEPAEPLELLAQHRRLERALGRERRRAASRSPPQPPGSRVRARRLDAVRRRRRAPRRRRRAGTGPSARRPVTTASTSSPGQRVPHEDAPGPRAVPRSGRRARPAPTSTTQPVADAHHDVGPAVASDSRARDRRTQRRRRRPGSRRPARPGARRRPRRLGPVARGPRTTRAATARADHDAGLEQQPALEPQRALVVQQLLPPVTDDVLGHVDDDEVARAAAAQAAHVVEDRPGDLAVRRVEHLERHGDRAAVPLGRERARCRPRRRRP